MLKIRLIQSLTVLIFLVASYSLSLSQETKEYKVVKGDTLWSISGKELGDSFLWPKVWKENPSITNPDKLYPGQIIVIPLYLIQKEKKEVEEAVPSPVIQPVPPKETVTKEMPPAEELRPLIDKSLLIASGYISPSVHSLGRITGSPSGRILFGVNDMIYVKTNDPAKPGDKFYIIRAEQSVSHPVTNKKMGYIVQVLGIAEVTDLKYGETGAKITQCYNDILSGDLLDTYYEMNPPLTAEPFRKPDIDGVVVASENMRVLNSSFDIVFIDKGKGDGIEIGDVFRTVASVGGHNVPNGTIQVINSEDTTATAVVRKATDAVMSGNIFTQLD